MTVANINIHMPDERTIGFPIHLRAQRSACFALGVRKSGSSIFSSIVNALALHENQAHAVDIPGKMFQEGYRYIDWNTPSLRGLCWPGNIYIGFRDAPTALYGDPVFTRGRKILMVRDPRDALVSEYFSNAYSHLMPETGAEESTLAKERIAARQATIAEYVCKRSAHLDATVEQYAPLLEDPTVKLIRYEDVILNKREWIKDIAAHFEFNIDDTLVDNILGWADVVPDAENEKAFVRRVVPGDFRNKLSPELIKQIEDGLSDIWEKFGYKFG